MFELFNQINQHIYAFNSIKQQQKKDIEKDIFFAISANSDLWNYFHINEWIKRRTIENKKTESRVQFLLLLGNNFYHANNSKIIIIILFFHEYETCI
jgi:hypothetical protein